MDSGTLSIGEADEADIPLNALIGRHLNYIVLTLGLLQVSFSILAFIDRLNPTVASRFYIVDTLIDDSFWAGIFLISGSLVLVSVKTAELKKTAMAVSASAFLVWGLLCFLKSLSTVMPIAWSVGLAVIALGIVAYKLCIIFTEPKL